MSNYVTFLSDHSALVRFDFEEAKITVSALAGEFGREREKRESIVKLRGKHWRDLAAFHAKNMERIDHTMKRLQAVAEGAR